MFQRILQNVAILAAGLVIAGCANNDSLSSFNPLKTGQAAKQANQDVASGDKKAGSTNSGALAMARLAERRGQTNQARELYERLLERDPDNPVLSHRLGVIHAREGRFDEADACLTRAMTLKPDDAEILRDLGYSLYLQHRLDDAQNVLEKALKLEPYDEAICNNLALIYGEQGRYDRCLAMFHRTCDEAQAYANLGFVYAQHGDLENAKAMYSRALTLDKNLRPAAEAMVQLTQFESQRREFTEMAKAQSGQADNPQVEDGRLVGAFEAEPPTPGSPPQIGQVSFQAGASSAAPQTSGEVLIP